MYYPRVIDDLNKVIKMDCEYAPIVLFSYNRKNNTKQVIEALLENKEALYTDIIIYSDAPKSEDDICEVNEVRNYIRHLNGFKSVTIVERDENYGLARNIIEGVTNVVTQFGSVIVLEDDIVVGHYFLAYMNNALRMYEFDTDVMEIVGYLEPVFTDDLPESMFIKNGYCWGWATWKNRWDLFSKKPLEAYKSMSIREKYHFDLEGSVGKTEQILYNVTGVLNTWAVFWDYTIFKNDGYVLVPSRSLVRNIGGDGSGEHQADETLNVDGYIDFEVEHFPTTIEENVILRKRISIWHKGNVWKKIKRTYYKMLQKCHYIKNVRKFF